MVDALPSAADGIDAAEGLIDGFTDTIRMRSDRATDAVGDLASDVRSFLPFSPAERGPLADLDEAGAGLTETFADGIDSTAGTVAGATAGAAGAAAGGGGGGRTVDVDVRFTGDSDVWDLIQDDVEVTVDDRLQRAGREADLRGTL